MMLHSHANSLTEALLHAADINLDAPENVNPAQAAEDMGNIEVLRVPLTGMRAALEAHSAAGGTVYAGLWTLVAGMEAAAAKIART